MQNYSQLQYKDTPDTMIEARALLAVGLDGSFVVLQVNDENRYLMTDVIIKGKNLADVLRFWPDTQPKSAGIYEFRGYSAAEHEPGRGVRMVHRGACTRVAC